MEMMRNELIGETPGINCAPTEEDEAPLPTFWGHAIPQTIPENPTRKVQTRSLSTGTNPWSADTTFSGADAPRRPRLDFASLPSDHNADAHEQLLSRQRTPYADGPVFRPHGLAATPKQLRTFA
jgi:hypothetical protein